MTDAQAITLLQGLSTEAQNEIDATASAYSAFDNSKSALSTTLGKVSNRVAETERLTRYVRNLYGVNS